MCRTKYSLHFPDIIECKLLVATLQSRVTVSQVTYPPTNSNCTCGSRQHTADGRSHSLAFLCELS